MYPQQKGLYCVRFAISSSFSSISGLAIYNATHGVDVLAGSGTGNSFVGKFNYFISNFYSATPPAGIKIF